MKPKLRLPMRIVVFEPPGGIAFAVQRGRFELLPPARTGPDRIEFEFPLIVAEPVGQPPRFTGEYSQGPASARFVYVNSGTLAGEAVSCWTRRAKVSLIGITPQQVAEVLATPGAVLEVRIHGRAKDGGPACASVPLLEPWTVRFANNQWGHVSEPV